MSRITTTEPTWVKWTLIGTALGAMALVLIVPLVAVFWEGLAAGWNVYWAAVVDADARHALWLTLAAAGISLVVNGVAGIAAAWAIARFRFPGRSLLITAIELPFSVSPVVVGLLFVLLFGAHGWFGPMLAAHDVKILFAMPGIVLATLFITFPFVVRELLPVMEAVGSEEEEAARVLGARGWHILWRVTLPNVKWGLIYGLILCSARAIGEFGAVSVVSGHIRGETNTMPLHVEILYNDYQYNAAFACASVLCLTALVTLALKAVVEWRAERALKQGGKTP
ncbi:MAG: sulfate ABC transporter permease subunit CysW [Planctomycetes bacterium]|nr:sulfate ABC transporter permease subunit CysW [Planctomycetota bacterium]